MDEINSILKNFDQFKELLIQNGLFDPASLSQLIRTPEEIDSETQLKLIVENIESRDAKEVNIFATIMRNSQLVGDYLLDPTDQGDSSLVDPKSQLINRLKELIAYQKTFGEELIVKNAKEFNEDNDNYSMTGRPRGFCIIIDNQLFDGLPFRTGSRADANRLSEVFSKLFFNVLRFTNKTCDQMKSLLENVSQDLVLYDHDALAVIILSHGKKDGIFGTDGAVMNVKSIFNLFNNVNCPQLRYKPKMFFLSACRGGKIDPGIITRPNFLSTGSLGITPVEEKLPTWSDIFVYYSTIDGYASLRNTTTGSWFGYELAHCLAEFAHKEHLNDLITIKVGESLQKRISEVDGGSAKQAIETQIIGSVKRLYFNPGLSITDKTKH